MIGFGLGLFLDGRVVGHGGISSGRGKKLNYGFCEDENVMMDGSCDGQEEWWEG